MPDQPNMVVPLMATRAPTRREAKTTDLTGLADAIAAFEAEFPDVSWSLSKNSGGCAMHGFDVVASSFVTSPTLALREMAQQLRADRARRAIAAQHAALLDAEYGPEAA